MRTNTQFWAGFVAGMILAAPFTAHTPNEIILPFLGALSNVATIYQVMKPKVNKPNPSKRAFVIFPGKEAHRLTRIKTHCEMNALNLQQWMLKACEDRIKQDEFASKYLSRAELIDR